MEPRKLLDILTITERLKNVTRHCYTSAGRHESVAEHSWMSAMMALLLRDEFPEADMDKVIKMCLIHDMGEAFTGDIPAFDKDASHEQRESQLLNGWVTSLPDPYSTEFRELYAEMAQLQTLEARIYKAIDNLEAVIQHNISDISTWIPLEYKLNLTYGNEKVAFSNYLTALREEIRKDTIYKIDIAKK
jgi:putative hydrolase of HD superfamily